MPDTGLVINPFTTITPDSSSAGLGQGRGGELLAAEIHGKYFYAAARGAMFSFNATAKTVPVVTSNLTSVFSLYNPVGSNKLLELAFLDVSQVVAATVVDTWGLYVSSPVLTAKGTFTTAGTAQAALLNSNFVGSGVPYSAFTHNGTPTRWMNVAFFGATTTTTNQISHYPFDGRAVIPPGSIITVATATAATTGSAADLDLSWIETAIV